MTLATVQTTCRRQTGLEKDWIGGKTGCTAKREGTSKSKTETHA